MRPVLFSSHRPMLRAENLNAVWCAYDGYKTRMPVRGERYSLQIADDFFPKYRAGKVIMIAHGAACCKTCGLDQPKPYLTRDSAKKITYVIAPSVETVGLIAKQSGVKEKQVLPFGLPRTDQYFRNERQAHEGRVYLYAPTFRRDDETQMPEIDWDWLDGQLTDGERIIVKAHMLTDPILKKGYSHITEIPNTEPSAPYLQACDVLVTDYSSIMVDAHILRIPVVLFEKKKGYTKTRGMYLPYPEGYASRYAETEAELLELMRTADGQQEEDLRFLDFAAGACDGHATERIVKLIKEAVG